MRGHVESFRIARVNNDVIDKKFGFVEVVKQLPAISGVSRGINLPIQRAKIEAIRIAWIDNQTTHVASRRAVSAPVVGIFVGISKAVGGITERNKLQGNNEQEGNQETEFWQ